jgi:hypothetical protein
MFGSSELYSALNVAAIQAKVDAYGTGYAIFSEHVIPEDCEGNKTVNFYMMSRLPESEIEMYNYIINCRALTMGEAMDISNTIINTISRATYNDCFIYAVPLVVIPPMDSTDNYNSPIEAIIKLRG